MAARVRRTGHGADGEMQITRAFSSAFVDNNVRICGHVRVWIRSCECTISLPPNHARDMAPEGIQIWRARRPCFSCHMIMKFLCQVLLGCLGSVRRTKISWNMYNLPPRPLSLIQGPYSRTVEIEIGSFGGSSGFKSRSCR